MVPAPRHWSWAALLVTLPQSQGIQQCHWPDGSYGGSTLIPCTNFALAGEAPCCWTGDYCTSDGYCVTNYNRFFYRGGCTKRDWIDNPIMACPHRQCYDTPYGRSMSVGVLPCNDTAFACGYVADAAKGCISGPVFQMGTRNLTFQFIPFDAGSTPSSPSASPTLTPVPGPSATQNTTSSCSVQPVGNEKLVLGLGVGIPLAIVTLAFAIKVVILVRQNKMLKQRLEAPVPQEFTHMPPLKETKSPVEIPDEVRVTELPAPLTELLVSASRS